MFPLKNASPEVAKRFFVARRHHHIKMRREFEANLTRMSELLAEHGGYRPSLTPLLMSELGVADRTIRKYKLVLEQRGCCPTCGQLMPVSQKDTP